MKEYSGLIIVQCFGQNLKEITLNNKDEQNDILPLTFSKVPEAILFYQEEGCLVVGGPGFVGVVLGGVSFFFSGPKR